MSHSLRSLSDHEIRIRTRQIVARERSLTLGVLLHLNEIERRKIHFKDGYGSMFEYCTMHLGYSASAATRRIRTARCVVRFPEVYALLESNQVNLSTISQVAKVLTADNRGEILRRICGKAQKEVDAIVAEYEPRAILPPDRVKTVVIVNRERTNTEPPERCELKMDNDEAPNRGVFVPATDKECDRSGCNTATVAVLSANLTFERRSVVQFSASEAFMVKLERVRSFASHRLPANASFEQVLDLALDAFIEKEDPNERQKRREERRRHTTSSGTTRTTSVVKSARHIPATLRDEVFVRDQQRCTYVAPDGTRCRSTRVLQIDHINPVARGGAATLDNLRLLCAHHNRLESERLMGRCGPPGRPSR